MVWAQLLLSDRQGAFVERLCRGVVAQFMQQGRQIVKAPSRVGVFGAELLLVYGQGALAQRLCRLPTTIEK